MQLRSILLFWMCFQVMGCVQVEPTVGESALAQRIQPPPGVGSTPPKQNEPSPKLSLDKKDDQLAMLRAVLHESDEPLPNPRKVETPDNPAAKPRTPAEIGVERLTTNPSIGKAITLEDAIMLAFRNQPRLRLFQERVEEARGRGQAAFAGYLPTLQWNNRSFQGRNPTGPQDGVALPLSEFSDARGYQSYVVSELFLQWTLWDFGRTTGRYHQAELNIDIAKLQSLRTNQTVVYEVARDYFLVLKAQAEVRVAKEAVRLAESVLDVSRKSLKQGVLVRDAVLRAEVQLAKARREVVQAERARLVAVAAFNQVVGINVSAPTEIVDRTDEPPFFLTLADCLKQAIDTRLEFRIAGRAIEAAAEGERATKADFAPRVYFEGLVAEQDGHKALHGPSETASINLNWRLYDGGKRLGDLRTANAMVRAAVDQAEVVCDVIAFEVNEAYRALEAAKQSIDLARPSIAQARENLRLITLRYENGNATPTDIVDAENSLIRSQQDLFNSQYDYLIASARLSYAMGTTPQNGIEVQEKKMVLP
jgi:outer membrane protein TolC